MRVFVLESGVRIEPYDDPVGALPVGGVSLKAWQEALFARFGLEPVYVKRAEDIREEAPHLVTYDNCFFTRRVLKSFLQRWEKQRPGRLALPLDCGYIRLFSTLQDFERTETQALFHLWGVPAAARFEDLRSGAPTPEPVEVIYKEKMLRMPMPEHVVGIKDWEHPITTSVVMHIRHWVHVLQANRLSIQVRWVDEIIARPWWGLWILAKAPWRRGRWYWRILNAANKIGRKVDIHPTARVEGSLIEEGVSIGAFALVRGSIISKGSVIGERATVAFSVVGSNAYISKNVVMYGSVAMEEANLGGSIQMALIGRRSGLTPRTTPMDVLPGRMISVKDQDQVVETDLPVLGSAVGHDTFVGADIYIAPGRAIPSGVRIVPQPERVLSRIAEPNSKTPGQRANMYVVKKGRMEELG